MYAGDYTLEDNIIIPFTTRAFATGIPTALVSGVVDIYEGITATPIITAETLTVSIGSQAGFNAVTIDATAAAGFEVGKTYTVLLDAGTVDSVSVISEVIAWFTISQSAAAIDLANGTDGLGAIKAETALIVADTNELQTDDVPGLIATLDVVVDTVKAETALIVADTNELQGDWTNTGRLDTILDSILTDTGTTLQTELDGIQADTEDLQTQIGTAGAGLTAIPETDANVTSWLGTAAATPSVAGVPEVDLTHMAGGTVPLNVLMNWMNQGANRTADSGTTTTLVDAANTEVDDFWNGALLVFRTGTHDGRVAIVTDFVAATDTITFAPALPSNVTTEGYTLVPGLGLADVQAWLGTLVTAATAGRPDVNMAAVSDDTAAADNLELFTEGTALGTLPKVDTQQINAADVVGDGNAQPWDGA